MRKLVFAQVARLLTVDQKTTTCRQFGGMVGAVAALLNTFLRRYVTMDPSFHNAVKSAILLNETMSINKAKFGRKTTMLSFFQPTKECSSCEE